MHLIKTIIIICRCKYEQGLLSVHCLLIFRFIPIGFDSTSEYLLTPCGIKDYSLGLALLWLKRSGKESVGLAVEVVHGCRLSPAPYEHPTCQQTRG